MSDDAVTPPDQISADDGVRAVVAGKALEEVIEQDTLVHPV